RDRRLGHVKAHPKKGQRLERCTDAAGLEEQEGVRGIAQREDRERYEKADRSPIRRSEREALGALWVETSLVFHADRERDHGQEPGYSRADEDLAEIAVEDIEEKHRDEGADHRAEVVHGAMKAERPPAIGFGDRTSDQRIPRARAHPLSCPIEQTNTQ